MPTLDTTTVRRLAFAKYLQQLGISQSHLPEPANASSVLILHDATEFLLQIASEVHDVGKSQVHFMEYWNLINPKLHPQELPQRESYRRLNKSRVALKHHGTLPSSLDIESFRNTATTFFEEAVPLIFGISFDEVSLVDFVEAEAPRSALRDAVTSLSSGNSPEAVANASLAFHLLLREYEQWSQHLRGRSPFHGTNRLRFLDSFRLGLGHGHDPLLATPEFSRQLGEFVDGVKEALEDMEDTLKILAMGINYSRYSRFQAMAPHLYWTLDGNYRVNEPSQSLTAEQAQFCIEFVIEVALKLQETLEDYSETA